MKCFVDSANIEQIQEALDRGFVKGVTTNPSILAKEERRDYRVHLREIIEVLSKAGPPVPLSIEVFATEHDEMVRQADSFMEEFGDYDGLTIKVPVGWDELRVVAALTERGIPVNATCAMSVNQAIMALGAGARYISLFWGRIRDTGYDAGSVVRDVRRLMDTSGSEAEIIVGSIRHMADVNEAFLSGAHIVTIPPQFFPKMCTHPKTDEAVHQFVTEFAAWMS